MATKPNPFAKDTKAVTAKFGKEGSKKEEAFDKMQAAPQKMKGGGVVGKSVGVRVQPTKGKK